MGDARIIRFGNSISAAIIIILLVIIYYPTAAMLVSDWGSNPDYSHGYLIPFISIYLFWHVFKEMESSDMLSSNFGLIPLGIGIALQSVAFVGSEHFLQGVSLIIVLWGIVFFLWGSQLARCCAVPIGYLIFMIPLPNLVWNKFSFIMKLHATGIAVFLLKILGKMAVLQEGNVIRLPYGSLEVADACSGLRSLMSMLALGVLIAFISKYALWKKWALVVLAIPVALSANIVRIIIMVILAYKYGIHVAESFIHTFSGILVFVIGFAMLIGFHLLFMSMGSQPNRKN
jgi:exosortase